MSSTAHGPVGDSPALKGMEALSAPALNAEASAASMSMATAGVDQGENGAVSNPTGASWQPKAQATPASTMVKLIAP